MYPQSRGWAVQEGAGADGVGSDEMQEIGGVQIEGGSKQRKKEVSEKITKYEIERGDRRDPHLRRIQMDGGVALIEEEEE